MKRIVALGLVVAGLLVMPIAASAHEASGPSVLGIPNHGGPSVLGVPYNGRPSVLGIPHRGPSVLGVPQHPAAAPQQFHHHGHWAPHRQPVWVLPQWAWNGWHWVWVPGYWAR